MTYGLLGYKIAYSLSPLIHSLIGGEGIRYDILDMSPAELKEKIPEAFSGLSGFNVTIPHKQAIMQYCQIVDPVAEKIGAVNTVEIRQGIWKGYNTDYLGFVRSLKDRIPDYLSFHPVIVGYGGAARAIAFGLESMGCMACTITGGEREEERVDFIEDVKTSLRIAILDHVPELPVLWINCTPVGGAKLPDVPEEFIHYRKGDLLYDLNYSPNPTHLEKQARSKGIKTMNGLRMLVCQAIESQRIWMKNIADVDPDINTIIRSIERLNNVS